MTGVEHGTTGSDHSDTVVVSGRFKLLNGRKVQYVQYAKLILDEKRSVSVASKSK